MKLVSNILNSKTYSIAIISVVYALGCIYLFNKYGIKFVNDSPRYLGYANSLSDGFYFDPLNFWYYTYVVFVFINQTVYQSLLSIIISQYVLGYLAVLALYSATETLTNNRPIAFLTCFLFIFFPDNVYWHSYILTESIYSSFLCFSLYALMRHLKLKTNQSFIFLTLTVLACFFCKPTSPALVIALLAPSLIALLSDPSYRFLKISGLVVACVAVLFLANKMISKHGVKKIYKKGDIIFAMHEYPNHPYHDLLTIETPQNLQMQDQEGALILGMAQFVVQNPLYWLKLFGSKLVVYLTHLRPYWSVYHNLVVVLLIWPSYYFGISAIRKKLISKSLAITVLTYFLIHVLIVTNTWVDWDGRFFVPLYPILSMLAAIGLVDKIRNSKFKADLLGE